MRERSTRPHPASGWGGHIPCFFCFRPRRGDPVPRCCCPWTWAGAFTLRALTVFAAFFVIHGAGLIDDFWNLPALLKLCLQIVAAALVTVGGLRHPLRGPGSLALRILGWLLTMVWIVGITNAMNLVDGVDGLAGGIACIASLSLGIVAILHGSAPTALLAIALLGSVAGFLIYNFPPARIFMGDSGSS